MRAVSGQAKYWPLTMGKHTIWMTTEIWLALAPMHACSSFLQPLFGQSWVAHFCTEIWPGHIWQGGHAATKRARSTLISISNTFSNLQILCLLALISMRVGLGDENI